MAAVAVHSLTCFEGEIEKRTAKKHLYFPSISPRYPSQSKRRKKRKALKEEQAFSEVQLHRERTLEKYIHCYLHLVHNTTDVLSAFYFHFWYVAIAVAHSVKKS